MFQLFPWSSRAKTEETDERALLEASMQSMSGESGRRMRGEAAAAVELADLTTTRVVAAAAGAMNEPSAQAARQQEKEKKKPRTLSHLIYSLVHLALWAQIGVLGRFWIGVAITHSCHKTRMSATNPLSGDQPIGCSLPEKTVRDVLAIMTANIVGSFAMGFLTENKAHILWFEAPTMPVSFLPENHFIQHYEELLTGLRVGFCGSMTTYSSWAFQLVSSLTRGDVGVVVAVLFLEISCSLVAFILGEQLAIRIHMLVVGICHHHKMERTALWHQLKKNAIFANMPRHNRQKKENDEIDSQSYDRHKALSVVEGYKGDQLWLLRRSSARSKRENNLNNRTERYDVNGTIVLDTPYLAEVQVVDESLPAGFDQALVVEEEEEEEESPSSSSARTSLSLKARDQHQHRTRAGLNLFFTALLLAQTAAWALLSVYDASELRRGCWLSLLVAPLGCAIRWKMCLQYNSGVLHGRLGWFPVGTFSINVSATVLNCIATAIENVYCSSSLTRDLYWLEVCMSAFKTGFCGSLSTVSTFVSEVNKYMLEYPRNYKGWLYFSASLAASITLGFLFYSWSVYIHKEC
jgi:fluoride ion exporter CrcB/FEX